MIEFLLLISAFVYMIAGIGFGLVIFFWTIIAAITQRVGKPTRGGLYNSFVWTLLTASVMCTLACVTFGAPASAFFAVLTFPSAIVAAIAGACYDNSRD